MKESVAVVLLRRHTGRSSIRAVCKMAKVLEGFGEPLWMLVRLLGISIFVGYILAVLGLDPYTMLGGIERLTSSEPVAEIWTGR